MEAAPSASLLLTPVYDALEYAAEHGITTPGNPILLEWLQLCAAIYFIDRHEVPLPGPDSLGVDTGLKQVLERLTHPGAGESIHWMGRRMKSPPKDAVSLVICLPKRRPT